MSHTPGVWFFQPHYEGQWLGNIISDLGDRNIRTLACVCQNASTEENLSNARLIAAAPEMLEALIDLVELADFAMGLANADGAEFDIFNELVDARKAIAKAKGKI